MNNPIFCVDRDTNTILITDGSPNDAPRYDESQLVDMAFDLHQLYEPEQATPFRAFFGPLPPSTARPLPNDHERLLALKGVRARGALMFNRTAMVNLICTGDKKADLRPKHIQPGAQPRRAKGEKKRLDVFVPLLNTTEKKIVGRALFVKCASLSEREIRDNTLHLEDEQTLQKHPNWTWLWEIGAAHAIDPIPFVNKRGPQVWHSIKSAELRKRIELAPAIPPLHQIHPSLFRVR